MSIIQAILVDVILVQLIVDVNTQTPEWVLYLQALDVHSCVCLVGSTEKNPKQQLGWAAGISNHTSPKT